MRTPEEYLAAITAVYPCPVLNGFERAYWLYETREAVRWIAGFIHEEYKRQLNDIEACGITSDCYEIIPLERQESRVRIDKLREKFPDVFADLVHLRASDAQRILGRHILYALARDKIGDDAIRDFEAVNVTDLEKVLKPHQTAGLIETYTKVTDWAVQEVEHENMA